MIQITKRERLLSIGLIAVILTWVIYAQAVRPTRNRIHTLQRIIPEKQVELRQLQAKSAEYTAIRTEFAQLRAKMASQEPDFQLVPFLEAMIEQHKLAGHVVAMEPGTVQPQPDYSEAVVTIEFQDISLKQLIDFLTAVDTSTAVIQVGSLHIRKDTASESLLDSTVRIHSPRFDGPTDQLAQR
ncbi:MAG: hypothetical protein A2Y76_09370 [Planctomycetes bacterium RBG_13_60_9]|nr:MAG: hypothetical protein A2Y76_09370 [Planctomycetes bacterium RBG_13_60_9]